MDLLMSLRAIEIALLCFSLLFGVFVVCMAVSDLRARREREASEQRADGARRALSAALELLKVRRS